MSIFYQLLLVLLLGVAVYGMVTYRPKWLRDVEHRERGMETLKRIYETEDE